MIESEEEVRPQVKCPNGWSERSEIGMTASEEAVRPQCGSTGKQRAVVPHHGVTESWRYVNSKEHVFKSFDLLIESV